MHIFAQVYMGYSPVLAVASNGTGEVLRVIGWEGGAGPIPATGLYIGSNGYVTNITDGVNIKGNDGAAGAGINIQVGTGILNTGTAVFSNSNGVSFGLSGSTITASINNPVQSSLVFSNSNNVSFGTVGSTLTAIASFSQTIQTQNLVSIFGSTGNISFANSNGIVFGGNNSTITASYTVPTVTNSSWTASAGTRTETISQLVFSNGNGVSFGLTGGTLTATVDTNYQSSGAYLTTAMLSNAATISNIKISAGSLSSNRSDLTFSNSNGVSFGLDTNGAITASVSVAAAGQTGISAISAGTTLMSSGTAIFSDGNGISFGVDGNTITATIKTDYQSSNANYLTSQSNQAFSASGSSSTFQTIQFGNSNGISFSISNGSIVGTVATNYQPSGAYLTTAALSSQTLAFSLSGNIATTNSSQILNGGYALAGGNGVTLQQSNNTISFSVATNYQSTGNYLTTAMQSGVSTQFVQANANFNGTNASGTISSNNISISVAAGSNSSLSLTAGNGSSIGSLSQLYFSNANGLSFGLSTSNNGSATLTASYTVPSIVGLLSAINVSAGTTSNNLSALTFNNSNGITFGLNGSVLTATVATNYQSQGAYLTTAALSSQTLALSLSGNVATTNSSQILNGGYALAGGNGVTLQQSNNTVSISVATNYQSQGAYLTTAMQSNAATISNIKVSAGASSSNVSALTFNNSNGVSFGYDGTNITATVATNYQSSGNYLTTARASNDGVGLNTALTANGVAWTVNSSGISLNIPAFLTTADLSANSSKYIQNWKLTGNTAGTTSSAQGTDLWLAGGNGVTISGSSNTLSFSVATNYQSQGAYLTTAMQSNAVTISNINLSAGTTSQNLSAFVFSNSNNATFGLSGSTVTVSSPVSFSAGTTNGNFTNIVFSNSNGVSFGLSGSTVTGSISQTNPNVSLYALGNTTQNSSTQLNVSNLSFNGLGAVTIGYSNGSIQISAPNAAAGNVTISAGASSGGLASLVFSNSNNISFGLSGSTITASASAQSNQTVGLYALGNTTQNSSTTLDARTMSYNGLGAMTVGYSNGSIQLSAPATSSLSGTGQVSISVNGSTISIGVPNAPIISSYENVGGLFASQTQTFNGVSVSGAAAFYVDNNLSASFLRIPVLMTMNSTTIATMASATATASGALYSTWNAVVYSLVTGASSQSLISVASGSGGWTFSQQISVTNSTQASHSLGFSAQAQGGGTTQTTQYSVSNTNYSFTTNAFTAFSSNRMLDIPFANSLPVGQYWLVLGYSSSSASGGAAGLAALTNCNAKYSNHYVNSQLNLSFGVMGSTNMTSGGLLGAGSFSTAGGGTTSGFNISAISSSSNNNRLYFQLLRSA